MRGLTITIALVTAAVAGAATSSAAILHCTGSAEAESAKPTKPTRVQTRPRTARSTRTAQSDTPSAARFARILAGSSNQYGQEHSAPERIRRVHCVPGAPGDYMCSYTVVRSGAPSECHLIQARWTPGAASTYTVTLSGRTARCRTLRDALDSLS